MFKPLLKKSQGTCVTNNAPTVSGTHDCRMCTALDDNYNTATPPQISPLAVDVAESGIPNDMGKDQVKSYPDSDGSPRFGRPKRPGEKEPPQAASVLWKLMKPPATEAPTEAPTPPTEL